MKTDVNTPPPWSEAPPWAKYMAQQPEGDWYVFSHKPFKTRNGFSYGAEWAACGKFSFHIAKGKQNQKWQDTLQERPENE